MPSYTRCGCQNQYRRSGNQLIVLDTAGSVLHPTGDNRQRFCYQISASDALGNVYVPMEYVILGLGSSICENDFYAVTVSVNGVMQNVVWGQNIWIVNADQGDGSAACSGIKLAFPLLNATDSMGVCLTMNRVFTVGEISSCLYAGGTLYTGIGVIGPAQQEGDGCPTTAYQEVDVCLPITITPFATVGDATVTCCGEPTITQGNTACPGTAGGQCSFTVSQRVCVALPVSFGANTQAGEYTVLCGNAGEGDCTGCAAGSAAANAARQALEMGMIRINQEKAHTVPYQQRQAQPSCSRCGGHAGQTRIQDLVRDPMIWRD